MSGSGNHGHARTRASLISGAGLGALWTTALVAVCALGDRLSLTPNIAYDLFTALSRELPGAVVTFGIDTLTSVIQMLGASSISAAAKTAEKGMAVVLTIGLGAGAGVVIAALSGSRRRALVAGIGAGVIGAVLFRWLESTQPMPPSFGEQTAMVVLLLGWGLAMGTSVMAASPHSVATDSFHQGRRALLVLTGMAGGTIVLAYGALRLLGRRSLVPARRTHAAASPQAPLRALTSGPAQSPPAEVLRQRLMPVPGTRSELTANADFYRVDINLEPPKLDGESWRLAVDGLIANPVTLTLEELRLRPAVSQVITLECISNPVGGDLIGTSRWTGCRVRDLLRDLVPDDAAIAIAIASSDGFYENLSMSDAMDERTLLVYEMNGVPLPVKHGYPLRLYAPNRHGMKLPKWIERLDIVDTIRPGYWVQRGWSNEAIPHTTSVIDTIRVQDNRVALGGIAYAGARGIAAVQVQIDDGPWRDAALRAPALSPLTWIQWRLDESILAGRHVARVRAVDGAGAAQETERRPPHPNGATGLHSRSFQA